MLNLEVLTNMKNVFLNSITASLVAAIGLTIASSTLSPASAASLSFDVSETLSSDSTPAKVKLTLNDTAAGAGKVQFKVDVVPNPNIADIRGVFFNILDNRLLQGLNITGANVTQFATGSINSLGQGNNINPGGPFEIGVEIGQQGLGRQGIDDIQSTTFTVAHSSQALTLAQFYNQDFGLRLQSVGLPGSNRNGSSKLGGTAPGSSQPVPEPGTIVATGLFALGVGLLKKKAIVQG